METKWHLTTNGLKTLCGTKSPNRIHAHYAAHELDEGAWCARCQVINRKPSISRQEYLEWKKVHSA